MGFTQPSPQELQTNTIAFGVPSVVFLVLRLLNSGWVLRKLRFEDYLMCGAFVFYISMLTFVNVAAAYNTNLYPPQDEAGILANPADVQNRILGSKLVIPLEQSMLLSTWGVKTCIWLFLQRLCRQLPNYQFALKYLIIYTWLGYFVIQLSFFAIFCRPFSQYWVMPVRNEQCATWLHYAYVQMVFNITSDIGLIAIPLCMFYIARLPLKRKFILMGVFSLAIFTITAAILNKVYNFLSPMTTTYLLWYIREASVAMWVGNLICCWQLIQRLFNCRSFDDKSDQIIAQPEMASRDPQFSVGGSRKTPSWFTKQREKMQRMGAFSRDFLARASRSYASQPSRHSTKHSNATPSNMTGQTYVDALVTTASTRPTTLMTLNRDGDDAGPAIAYRNQEEIV